MGLFGGLFGGSTSLTGPPVILFGVNQSWQHETFRANLILYGALTFSATLFVFGRLGLLVPSTLRVAAAAVPSVILGFILGLRLKPYLSEWRHTRLALGLSLLGGLLAFADGLRMWLL